MESPKQTVETSDSTQTTVQENFTLDDVPDTVVYLLSILVSWMVPFEPLDNDFLGGASIMHVLLDALFLYVPLINEDIKCVTVNDRLKIAALVLRCISDLRYLVRIIFRIKDARRESQSLIKIAKSTAVDTFCLVPIPQVVVLTFLPNMRGSSSLRMIKFLNSLVVLQYLARAYPVYAAFKGQNTFGARKGLQYRNISILSNLVVFFLASHVLGAFWYFFSIQREIDCWRYASRSGNERYFTTSCDEGGLINVTLIRNHCPINPPEATIFDFGIFLYALQSGIQESTNFPQKVLQCFCWGLRNLSSFASNLNTSTYGWENVFVIVISISGLVLFMYLLGFVQTFMQARDISDIIRDKMETIEPKIQELLTQYNLPPELRSIFYQMVRKKLDDDEDFVLENMFSILSSNYSEVATDIKSNLFIDKLKKVDGLQDKGDAAYKDICKYLEPKMYTQGSYIIREGEPLDMIFFVTQGSVLTFSSNAGGSNGSSGTIQLEKEKDGLYGEEIITWAEEPSCKLSKLPISAITVKCHDEVEVFVLLATKLQSIVSKFPNEFNKDGNLTIAVHGDIAN